MVCLTGVAVAMVLTGGTAGIVAAATGAGLGTVGGAAGGAAGVAGAAAAGTSAGAIAGASAAGTAAGAGVGAVAGGTAAGGVGGSLAGAFGLAAGTGGWGLLAVGTNANSEHDQITYDCWKPVVHDKSTEQSSGMLLRELVCHPNIAKVTMAAGTELPNIVIQNIWQETFEIQYLLIHGTGKLACHAKPVDTRNVFSGTKNVLS